MSIKERISEGEDFVVEQKSRDYTSPTAVDALRISGTDGVARFNVAPHFYTAAGAEITIGNDAAGPTGPTGVTGSSVTGPAGVTGSSVTGPAGVTGSSVTGPTGVTGSSVTGPTGPTGPDAYTSTSTGWSGSAPVTFTAALNRLALAIGPVA